MAGAEMLKTDETKVATPSSPPSLHRGAHLPLEFQSNVIPDLTQTVLMRVLYHIKFLFQVTSINQCFVFIVFFYRVLFSSSK